MKWVESWCKHCITRQAKWVEGNGYKDNWMQALFDHQAGTRFECFIEVTECKECLEARKKGLKQRKDVL